MRGACRCSQGSLARVRWAERAQQELQRKLRAQVPTHAELLMLARPRAGSKRHLGARLLRLTAVYGSVRLLPRGASMWGSRWVRSSPTAVHRHRWKPTTKTKRSSRTSAWSRLAQALPSCPPTRTPWCSPAVRADSCLSVNTAGRQRRRPGRDSAGTDGWGTPRPALAISAGANVKVVQRLP